MPLPNNQEISRDFANHEDYKYNLMYHIGYDSFYLWNDGYYRLLNDRDIINLIWNYIGGKWKSVKVTMAMIKDVQSQLKLACLRVIEEEHDYYIAFSDKLLNTLTGDVVSHDRDRLATFYLPFEYDKISQDIPIFKRFLETSLVLKNDFNTPDDELIHLVQEMFGYFLMGSDTLQKNGTAWFLVGGGANGKSIMLGVLQNIFGNKFCSSLSIQSLTNEQFNLPHIIGKKINISNEDESKYIKSDKYKALITGNPVNTRRLFSEPFEFFPKTKYICATNKILTFDSVDYALKRRIKMVSFFRKFLPTEMDHSLPIKLKDEIPGIVGWALKGMRRLLENNYVFSEAKSTVEAMKEFESEISSALRFIAENYVISDADYISNDLLYEGYKIWCDKNGKKPLSSFNFQNDIGKNIDGIKYLQRKDNNGKRMSCRNLMVKDMNFEELDVKQLKF